MNWISSLCRNLIALLLLLSVGACAASDQSAKLSQLAQDPQWLLLLHDAAGAPQLRDAKFLLSHGDYSPVAELAATLDLFRLSSSAAYCRFPARLHWAQAKGLISLDDIDTQPCAKLAKYLADVPFQQLDLVFATEVLSSTTSMMGHVFFKAQGIADDGVARATTLAYFTRIRSLNPLVLVYENTVSGMEGYVVVRDFNVDAQFYRGNEQRTVWQYQLVATPAQLELLQLHLYELKDTQIDYYFQAFNCATLTLEVIALLDPAVMHERGWIVTPVDVVKAAHQYGLVAATDVMASERLQWLQLTAALPSADRLALDTMVQQGQPLLDGDAYLQDARAEQYVRLRTAQAVANGAMTRSQQADLLQPWHADPATRLSLTQLREPTTTPPDSLLGLGWQQPLLADGSRHSLRWLANGHLLYGDNSGYQAESELQMGNIVLSQQSTPYQDEDHVQVSEFTLYSVRSLAVTTSEYPRWAGEFYLGYQPLLTPTGLQSQAELATAAGKSYALGADALVYALVGAGAVTDWRQSHAYAVAKVGGLWSLSKHHKVGVELERNSGKVAGDADYLTATVQWHWQLAPQWALLQQWRYTAFGNIQDHSAAVQLVRYY